jgi:hypothetical protein
MSVIRNNITAACDTIDRVTGPGVFDIRPTTCTIITRIWAEGQIGKGSFQDTGGSFGTVPLQIPPYVRIRHVTEREIAGSGGLYEEGDVIIGPIRPPFVHPVTGQAGGFTEAQVAPKSKAQGTQIIYRLVQADPAAGGINGDMALVEFKRDRVYRYMVVVGRLRTTP